jgi:tetratricopeptide (TPR) repeat protein
VRTNLPADQRVVVVEGEEMGTARERIQDFWALYRQATHERTVGQTQAAAATYARALALNPDHEDVLYYFGSMRFALGDFAAAERAWRHLIARNPSSARTHSQLGSLYLCLDAKAPFQPDSAETHLRRAYEINKEETGPLLHLGEVALVRNDRVEAGRYFNEVLGSHAKSAEARFYVGYIALKGADTVRAQTEFSRATSATAPPPAAGLPGEGDTKHGAAPLMQRTERCDQLRTLATAPRTASPTVEMLRRYRRLDSLLSVARSRIR